MMNLNNDAQSLLEDILELLPVYLTRCFERKAVKGQVQGQVDFLIKSAMVKPCKNVIKKRLGVIIQIHHRLMVPCRGHP